VDRFRVLAAAPRSRLASALPQRTTAQPAHRRRARRHAAFARDDQGAIGFYQRAIAVDDTLASAHLNLGFELQKVGQAAQGQAELNKAVALDPSLKARIPTATTTR
jgi:tetratricopeptide (TPR) repeat protein